MMKFLLKNMKCVSLVAVAALFILAGCSDYADDYKKTYKATYGSATKVTPEENGGTPTYEWRCADEAVSCNYLWRAYDGADYGYLSVYGGVWSYEVYGGASVVFNAVDDDGRPYTIDMLSDDVLPYLRTGGITGKASTYAEDDKVSFYLQFGDISLDQEAGVTVALAATNSFYVSLYEIVDGVVVSEYRSEVFPGVGATSENVETVSVLFEDMARESGEAVYDSFISKANAVGITFVEAQEGENEGFSIVGIALYNLADEDHSDKGGSFVTSSSATVKSSSATAKSSGSTVTSSAAETDSSFATPSFLWRGDIEEFKNVNLTWNLSESYFNALFPVEFNTIIDDSKTYAFTQTMNLIEKCLGVCGNIKEKSYLENEGFDLKVDLDAKVDLGKVDGLCFGVTAESMRVSVKGHDEEVELGRGKYSYTNVTWKELGVTQSDLGSRLSLEFRSTEVGEFNIQVIGSFGSCANLTVSDNKLEAAYDMLYPYGKSAWMYLNPSLAYGEITDERDLQVYKTVKLDYLEWFAENLNYGDGKICGGPGVAVGEGCERYGRLYTQSDLQKGNGVCPEGWRVANDDDWNSLNEEQKTLLSQAETFDKATGTNENGLSLIAAGRYVDNVLKVDGYGYYWQDGSAGNYQVVGGGAGISTKTVDSESEMYSVRCVKGELPASSCSSEEDVLSSSSEETVESSSSAEEAASSSAVEKCSGTVIYDASADPSFVFGNADISVHTPGEKEDIYTNYSDEYGLGARVSITESSDYRYGTFWFGYDDRIVDASDWDGLCIVYQTDANLEFGFSSLLSEDGNVASSDVYVTLENTNGEYEKKEFSWNEFYVENVSITKGKALSSLHFLYAGLVLRKAIGSANFKISQITTKTALTNGINDLEKGIKYVCGNGMTYNPEIEFCGSDKKVYEKCAGSKYDVAEYECVDNVITSKICIAGAKDCFYWSGEKASKTKSYTIKTNRTSESDGIPWSYVTWGDYAYVNWLALGKVSANSALEEAAYKQFENVIDACKGLCGTYVIEGSDSHFALSIDLNESRSVEDVSLWEGLCITYESSFPLKIRQALYHETSNQLNWNLPIYTAEITEGIKSLRIPWKDFVQEETVEDPEKMMSGVDGAMKMVAIEIMSETSSMEKPSGFFAIYEIGSLNTCLGESGNFKTPDLSN